METVAVYEEQKVIMLRVLGFPLLENTKVVKNPFHVFDRYEIHIQDRKDCLQGSSSFSGAPPHES